MRVGYTHQSHTRRAFTRKPGIRVKHATVKRTRVPAGRIEDRGAPGKWSKTHGPGIGKLKPGGLTMYGYTLRKRMPARHQSLRRSVHRNGPLSTFRKLNAVAVYSRRTDKGASQKYTADRNWVKKTFMSK